MRFLRELCDLILLNVLWGLCSLPVITMGAATSAMYAVTLKKARNEEKSIIKEFFHSFKTNFLQATLLELIALAVGLIVYGDFVFAQAQEGTYRTLFLTVATIVALLLLIYLTFTFPQQAMFQNTLKKYIINAFALAFCAPFRMLLIWIIWAVPIGLILLWPQMFINRLGFVWMMCGISGSAYLCSFVYRKIFDRFQKPQPGGNDDAPEAEAAPDDDTTSA